MSYEFSNEDESVILTVSNLGILLSVLLILTGIISYLDAILDEASGASYVIALIQGLILLIIGIMFLTPTLAFRRVATTEGRDIEEMVGGLGVFGQYLYVTIALIGISVVLGIVEALI